MHELDQGSLVALHSLTLGRTLGRTVLPMDVLTHRLKPLMELICVG